MRHAYTPITSSENDFDRVVKQEEFTHIKSLVLSIKSCLRNVDYIFCSHAVRAKQTYDMLKPYLEKEPTTLFCDVLYNKKEAYSEVVWDLLKEVPASKKHVMIIGHNPGLTNFYNSLSVPSYEFIHFPTLGIATVQFPNMDWEMMNERSAIERSIRTA